MATAIRVDGVSKRYRRYAQDRPRTLKESILRPAPRVAATEFWALRDVTFDVTDGRTIGVIGPNGAGKSTLLRLIGGVGRSDGGHIEVTGRLAALFELGAGFHPELTGRESTVLSAVIAGLTRREALRRLDDVVEFAELTEFIDSPLRTYSSGMQARLAFAIACNVDPDVLLIDEVLAVGDIAFQERCLDRIRRFQRDGVTIALVSHDPSLVAELCDEVLWLRGGRLVGQGAPTEVTERYRTAMAEETRLLTPADVPDALTPSGQLLRIHDNRFGSQEATIGAVRVVDRWGEPCTAVETGAGVCLQMEVASAVERPAQLGVTLTRADGLVCLDTSTAVLAGDPPRTATLDIARLDLAGGMYTFDVGLYDVNWERTYDFHWRAYPLQLRGPLPGSKGTVLAPPLTWRVG